MVRQIAYFHQEYLAVHYQNTFGLIEARSGTGTFTDYTPSSHQLLKKKHNKSVSSWQIVDLIDTIFYLNHDMQNLYHCQHDDMRCSLKENNV